MKTMLDKCAVAGDITQAIDRRGAWSCAVTVIGGTENTAVKLQSADSAGGEFTDFKTLISADEAEADQYKGFVVDISGAGNFVKVVGATMATCVLGDCDHDVKTVAIKAGEIPSGADLENNKTATIDVSTYTEPVEIEPTAGKDGMKKATVTLSNIPSGGINFNSTLTPFFVLTSEDGNAKWKNGVIFGILDNGAFIDNIENIPQAQFLIYYDTNGGSRIFRKNDSDQIDSSIEVYPIYIDNCDFTITESKITLPDEYSEDSEYTVTSEFCPLGTWLLPSGS